MSKKKVMPSERASSERGILPMKNSDMKVIAIILSIALFITIITSNAVAVASVILLARDGGTVVEQGGQAAPQGGTTSTTPSGSTSSSSTSSSSSSSSSSTEQTTAPSGSGTSTDKPADKPADNANDAVIADPLAFFQKAAKDIHENGSAGYTKKGWQTVEGDLQLDKLTFLSGPLTSLIKTFMTEESAAEEKINEKGSDDAKNRMPISNCAASDVASATAKKLDNGNYEVVIVMKDVVNPSYSDTTGLVLMSKEFLDIKDVQNTVATDETVKKLVKSVDGTITYKAYTITAEMTADGKFVSITHFCAADIVANVEAVAGSLGATGALGFNAKYYDFKY